VPITTKAVSWNPANGEVYSIQHYVITFVSGLWQVGCFLQVPRFIFTVALNTITLTLSSLIGFLGKMKEIRIILFTKIEVLLIFGIKQFYFAPMNIVI
jgi:hypothetical protein